MAYLVGEPTVERLQDIMDVASAGWGGVEISFHVMPAAGEEWGSDLAAACLLDGRPVTIPEAVSQSREWDTNPESSFSCYAPVGDLKDGAHLTLLVQRRAERTISDTNVLWRGEFRVHYKDGRHHLTEIVSLSDATREQLLTLPGIGPKIAEVIIAYRQIHGPFGSVEQLGDVPMMGAHKLQRLRGTVRP